MSEETTNPVEGEALPEVVDAPVGESEDPIQVEGDEGNQETDETDGADQDLIDIEYEGANYKVPPALKDALLRQADYTKKTQEVAEARKSIEATKAQVEAAQARQMEFAGDIAKLGALDDKLAPYQQVQDWPNYLRTGGAEAQAHFAEYQALKAQRDAFVADLGQRVQQRQTEEQRETAKLIEESRSELAKHIPGYSPETLAKLEAFAAPFGFSSDEIRQAEADPRSIRILHLAEIGQEALTQRKAAQRHQKAQAVTPAATVSPRNAPPQGPSDRMGTDAWMRAREQQLRKAN